MRRIIVYCVLVMFFAIETVAQDSLAICDIQKSDTVNPYKKTDIKITNADGTYWVDNLTADEIYMLRETKAPDGYVLPDERDGPDSGGADRPDPEGR